MTGTRAQFQGGSNQLVIDFLPDTIEGNDDDPVDAWADTTGRFAWLKYSDGSRPILKKSIANGHAVLRSDGTKQMVGTFGGLFRSAGAIYVVVKNLDSAGYCVISSGYGDEWSRWNGNGLSYPGLLRDPRVDNLAASMPTSGDFIQVCRSSASEYSFGKAGAVMTGLTPAFKADWVTSGFLSQRRFTLFAAAVDVDKPMKGDIAMVRFACNFLPHSDLEAEWIDRWESKFF